MSDAKSPKKASEGTKKDDAKRKYVAHRCEPREPNKRRARRRLVLDCPPSLCLSNQTCCSTARRSNQVILLIRTPRARVLRLVNDWRNFRPMCVCVYLCVVYVRCSTRKDNVSNGLLSVEEFFAFATVFFFKGFILSCNLFSVSLPVRLYTFAASVTCFGLFEFTQFL